MVDRLAKYDTFWGLLIRGAAEIETEIGAENKRKATATATQDV